MEKMKSLKKRTITLMEILVVMILIGIIMSAIGYRVMGTLDKGKVFATEQSMKRLRDVLNLAVAQNPALISEVDSNWQEIVQNDPTVDPSIIRDAWGYEFIVTVEDNVIYVESRGLENYRRQNQ